MKEKSNFLLTIILCLFSLSAVLAQAENQKTATYLDLGSLENNVYTNKTLNLQLKIADEWQIQADIVKKIIKDQGAKSVKGKTAATQNALDKQMKKVNIVFTAFKNPAGSPENASFILVVEDMRSVPVVKSAKDYLELALNTYRNMKLPDDFSYTPEIKYETIASTNFGYIETIKGTMKQRFYTIFRKGFGVMFMLSYVDDNGLESMRAMMSRGNFKYFAK